VINAQSPTAILSALALDIGEPSVGEREFIEKIALAYRRLTFNQRVNRKPARTS
jgi:hypothetical protein